MDVIQAQSGAFRQSFLGVSGLFTDDFDLFAYLLVYVHIPPFYEYYHFDKGDKNQPIVLILYLDYW